MILILNLRKLLTRNLRRLKAKLRQCRPDCKKMYQQRPKRTEKPRLVPIPWKNYTQESKLTGYLLERRFLPMQRAMHGSHARKPWSSYRVSSKPINDSNLQWVHDTSLSNVLLTLLPHRGHQSSA